MIASQQIAPPGQLNPDGIDEVFIGVRILLLPDALDAYVFPENNRIGTLLLCRLLEARMELAEVRVIQSSGSLEFNWSYYLFSVSKRLPAMEAVKEELEKLGLLAGAQIAWRDPREEIFRVWYSKSGRFDVPTAAQSNADKKALDALTEAAKKPQQLEDESPGQ
jgi:hypothetical protein